MTRQEIERKANKLASQVIPADVLDSFIALPLESKLTGIALFAKAGGDDRMMNAAIAAYNSLSN